MRGYVKGVREDQFNHETLGTRKAALRVVGVGSASEMGRRDYNEDEILMRPKFAQPPLQGPLSFFALFDGHGGRKAAEYARDHLLDNLKFSIWQGLAPEDAFRFAYQRTEFDFFESSPVEETSGTTAVSILLEHGSGRYWCANAGDSRAVLCRAGGKAIPLSNDHRVNNPKEVQRIEELGGFIKNRRAMGRLECFRTIGDADVDSRIVTSEPEVISGVLEDEDECFLIGCDGLFDVLSNEEAAMFVQEHRGKGMGAKETAQRLVEHAIHTLGSRDNVTAILVFINNS
jgi:serine/threonine protein phosphatase PrpC